MADFVRGERFWKVFQDFLVGFFKVESRYDVATSEIPWLDLSGPDTRFVPDMETDMILRNPERTIIVDAKYHKETLVSKYSGPKRFQSDCFYQICTYLQNFRDDMYPGRQAQGLLIFPWTEEDVKADVVYQGHPVRVATVDLRQSWRDIHRRLLDLVEGSPGQVDSTSGKVV